MEVFHHLILHMSNIMRAIGGITLIGMMLLTVVDVAMRYFGNPILGTYELVFLGGAVVIGFSLPQNSLDDRNVYVDTLSSRLPRPVAAGLTIITRCMGIGLFLLLGYAFMKKAGHLLRVGEVSNTLHIPLGMLGYGLGFCAFAESLVLILILMGWSRKGESHE